MWSDLTSLTSQHNMIVEVLDSPNVVSNMEETSPTNENIQLGVEEVKD